MIIPMLCVTIFVILVVWFLLPRVARLMIHTPTAISIFVCLSMVQLMAVFRSEERFSRNAETDLVCRLLLEKKKTRHEAAPRDTRQCHQDLHRHTQCSPAPPARRAHSRCRQASD